MNWQNTHAVIDWTAKLLFTIDLPVAPTMASTLTHFLEVSLNSYIWTLLLPEEEGSSDPTERGNEEEENEKDEYV